MLFVTCSQAVKTNARKSYEGKPYWIKLESLDKVKIFDDLKYIIERVSELDENSIFTAKSEFDSSGKMIKWEFEEY